MISETDGRIAPAKMAEIVPNVSNSLSCKLMYLKNLLMGNYAGGASSSGTTYELFKRLLFASVFSFSI